MDQATNVAAGAAVVSPWWLPKLQEVSAIAAELLPILGAIWFFIQSIYMIRNWRVSIKERKKDVNSTNSN